MLSLLSLQKMKRFDRTLASHALDICILSLIVAMILASRKGSEMLGVGALLHDIGYVRLPRNLYREVDLPEQEHTHDATASCAWIGHVTRAKRTGASRRIIVEHHECHNGNGFPHGIKGDSFRALANRRLGNIMTAWSVRRGGPSVMPHDAIRQLFYLGSIGQFSKELVESVVKTLGVYPIGSLVQLNTKEQAVVMAVNPAQRLKPIVKIITGPRGESYSARHSIDLAISRMALLHGTIARSVWILCMSSQCCHISRQHGGTGGLMRHPPKNEKTPASPGIPPIHRPHTTNDSTKQ